MSDRETADNDLTELYAELRKIAGFQIRKAAHHPTLHPTMLVHEAWVRLNGAKYRSKTHYLSLASRVMRNVVVDYIRRKTAERRGGAWQKVTLEVQTAGGGETQQSMHFRLDQILDVDRALELLAEKDERKAKVVEMRFFGGMEFEEIAEILGISVVTVKRDWAFARAWLGRNLSVAPADTDLTAATR
ncbi:MAG: sigma-70 family RNA polymerase sigma factor [Bryobacterales bacterium]|nr:sigma-70 family RNA polymerase sigma factor [Bryobacterales bacterium]